jgi:hypothetical protein
MAPELDSIGMVRSATWSDIDTDSSSELIVVGEWMPIQILSKSDDALNVISSSSGVNSTVGLWNVVVSLDFDNDGDKDLLVGNVGLNNRFAANYNESFHILANDFDYNDTLDIILSTFRNGNLVPIQSMPKLDSEIPAVISQFSSHKSFANSNVKSMFDHRSIKNATHFKLNTFASTLFVNNGDTLNPQKLPVISQISSINDFSIIDYNCDNFNDVLLGGNDFNIEFDKIRNDASTGTLLKNQGGMAFNRLRNSRSNFFVPHNVRTISKISLGSTDVNRSILVGSNQDTLRVYTIK